MLSCLNHFAPKISHAREALSSPVLLGSAAGARTAAAKEAFATTDESAAGARTVAAAASVSTGGSAAGARTAAAVASASTGGSTAIARSAAAAACASTDGSAGTARIAVAACGLMHPRACWISSATLVACVKYASVCASLGGRNSHGRRPARGRASFSGGEVDRGKWQFGARQRRFSRQKGSTSGRQAGEISAKKGPTEN